MRETCYISASETISNKKKNKTKLRRAITLNYRAELFGLIIGVSQAGLKVILSYRIILIGDGHIREIQQLFFSLSLIVSTWLFIRSSRSVTHSFFSSHDNSRILIFCYLAAIERDIKKFSVYKAGNVR